VRSRDLRLSRRSVLLGTAAVLVEAGCQSTAAAPVPSDRPVVIATGSTVGVYYQYATAFRAADRNLGLVSVLSTTGSVENMRLLTGGPATLAFSAADAAMDAFAGAGSTDPARTLRALGRLYDDYLHLVVPATAPVRTIADLRGLAVCVGATGSGTALIADRLLTVAGIDPERDITRRLLSLNDAVTALHTGELAAFFWSGGLPTMAITTLANQRPVRLVDLADPARQLHRQYGTAYRVGAIPAGTYPGNTSSVYTVAVPNLLVTTTDLPAGQAQGLIAALFASAPRIGRTVPVAAQLDRHTAIYTEPIPLHDGAVTYYRSVAVDV
jgi:TRAP transporter TAXI family solute receptor